MQAGKLHDADAVMLVVVGHEGDLLVLVRDARLQNREIPVAQARHVRGAQDDVPELRGYDLVPCGDRVDAASRRALGHGSGTTLFSMYPMPSISTFTTSPAAR